MIKKKLFVWACDYSSNSGEGRLGRLFIEKLCKKKNFLIKLNQKKTLKSRYLSVLFGIIYCWQKYLKNEKVCYLNYLPLWNFLIFIFLPPRTILGPITGGANYSKSNILSFILRGIFFPFFYKISELFLYQRKTRIIFSTDLLKQFLFKKTINKSDFNFILKNFDFKKSAKKNKKIDLIIYYRKHKNKEIFFPYNLIKKLIKLNFKIYILGDKLNLPNVKNLGHISNKKVKIFQSQAKFTIASGENLYSFFILECITNHVKIIVEKNIIEPIDLLKKNFIKLDYNSLYQIKKLKQKIKN